jgi:alpha/beta superfamily hydrolase
MSPDGAVLCRKCLQTRGGRAAAGGMTPTQSSPGTGIPPLFLWGGVGGIALVVALVISIVVVIHGGQSTRNSGRVAGAGSSDSTEAGGVASVPVAPAPAVKSPSLADARRDFKTHIVRNVRDGGAPDQPPSEIFDLVHYPAPPGNMAAYLSVNPKDHVRHPAILWVFGGFGNGIGETAWVPAPASNDQSASAFRKAGIIMMYPSFRGGNDNPGVQESFYGEVDDLLAAAAYLAKLDDVDPARIYLGGHSTGGTLVLLAAESSDRFRAVFSLGPVANIEGYGKENFTFDTTRKREFELRAPMVWLSAITNPTFVIEGTGSPSNHLSVMIMSRLSRNPQVHFLEVPGTNHFSELSVTTPMLAQKIMADNGPACTISITPQDIEAATRLAGDSRAAKPGAAH